MGDPPSGSEFAGHTVAYGGSQSPMEDRPFTIEGGDVIVLNEEAVLIGVSERTRSETIKVFARKAFSAGHAKRCYEIPIPTERTFMHLDTVFTIVDRGVVVWYPGVMERVENIEHFTWDPAGVVVRKAETRSLRSEEHTSELQSRFGISYAVFCLKKKKQHATRTRVNSSPVSDHVMPHGVLR